MSEYREPVALGKTNKIKIHHEDITPADAGLFGTFVSFTGPNAATWMDALSRMSSLLSCNEDYARFDQDPDNLKRCKYPPPPLHLQDAEAQAAAQAVSGSTSTPTIEPALAHGYGNIVDLPKKLREEIWLTTEEPRILGAEVLLLEYRTAPPRAIIAISASGYGTALHGYLHSIRNPRWDDIKLYGLCSEAHNLAIREYGQSSVNSVPCRHAPHLQARLDRPARSLPQRNLPNEEEKCLPRHGSES